MTCSHRGGDWSFLYCQCKKHREVIYLFVDYMINVPIMKEIGLVLTLSAERAREDNCFVHIINVPIAEKTNVQLYTLGAKSIVKTKLFLIWSRFSPRGRN